MGDVVFENDISEMPVTVYNDTVRNTSFRFDSLGFYSSMDDIFTRLLTLASYISHRFVQFIENLARRDADRCSDDLLVNSAGQHLRSLRHGVCNFFAEGCSSSSNSCISGRNPGICERASEPREDARTEIVAANSSYAVVPFIFKGLLLPLHGLQFAWRLAMSCCRSSVAYVRCTHLRICSTLTACLVWRMVQQDFWNCL